MNQENYQRASDDELASEARRWESGAFDARGWIDAPEAIPRVHASTPISLRVPTQMLRLLKLFAERERVGYQVLIKRWLDERLREERDELVSLEPERMFEGMEFSELLMTGS